MDFITHALIGAGAARLISRRREWIPQLSLAAVLAAELQDADFWLYVIQPYYYGKYHRVASHNLWALAAIGLTCAAAAWAITRVAAWRRFGWFVADNLPQTPEPVAHAPFLWFALVANVSAYLHVLADMITGFGNIFPFWPWSEYDASLHAVTSFDIVVFCTTFSWHLALRSFSHSRRREILITIVYAAIVVFYVLGRKYWASPTVW